MKFDIKKSNKKEIDFGKLKVGTVLKSNGEYFLITGDYDESDGYRLVNLTNSDSGYEVFDGIDNILFAFFDYNPETDAKCPIKIIKNPVLMGEIDE